MNTHELETLDKELAELLGWTDVVVGKRSVLADNKDGFLECEPRWTQDDGAAFRLMVDHSITVMVGEQAVSTYQNLKDFLEGVSIDQFESKEQAVRVVIVKAVIFKLKEY